MKPIAYQIAKIVAQQGGRAYYVGGCVRDRLLGLPNKDVDIEVHGISPDVLLRILKSFGEPKIYGAGFGVYGLAGMDIDIAMPRKEESKGRGHKDFDILVDPYIGITEAARRRDFTINAIMEDVLTGEIMDPFEGREDLSNGILRHIDDQGFSEDPLRVFRGAQFVARFGLSIDPSTVTLCRTMDVSALRKERVEEELKKAFLKSRNPSLFFETLRQMDQLSFWFSEVEKLVGVQQDPCYHPEGDVWIHTMQVIDRAADYIDKVSNPYAFMLLALTHDFGKITTTTVVNNRIHAYGHEKEGLPLINEFLHRITNEKRVIHYVINMVPLHMKPNVAANAVSGVKSTNHLFDASFAPLDLIYFALCDKLMDTIRDKERRDFLFSRYQHYAETMAKPYVCGKDLIKNGIGSGEDFKALLDYAHKLRLADIEKESALKQTLAYAKQLRK